MGASAGWRRKACTAMTIAKEKGKAGAQPPAALTAAEAALLERVKEAENMGLTIQETGGPLESIVENIVGNSDQITADALIRLSHVLQKAEAACAGADFTMACLWDAVRRYALAYSPKGRDLLGPHLKLADPTESEVPQ